MPGFQTISRFLHHFVSAMAKLATSSIRVNVSTCVCPRNEWVDVFASGLHIWTDSFRNISSFGLIFEKYLENVFLVIWICFQDNCENRRLDTRESYVGLWLNSRCDWIMYWCFSFIEKNILLYLDKERALKIYSQMNRHMDSSP